MLGDAAFAGDSCAFCSDCVWIALRVLFRVLLLLRKPFFKKDLDLVGAAGAVTCCVSLLLEATPPSALPPGCGIKCLQSQSREEDAGSVLFSSMSSEQFLHQRDLLLACLRQHSYSTLHVAICVQSDGCTC